ncbi:MAG: vWA domain-containing protein [Ignavibacteriales bacterium]
MGFDSTLYDRREAYEAAKAIGNFLNLYFSKEQGVRLGESCVASLKAHGQGAGLKGHIKVLINRDAGQYYLDYIDPGMVVNLNVCHKSGVVDPRKAALKIWAALEEYAVMDVPRLSAAEDERQDWVSGFAMKVYVTTRGGKGTVYDLIYNNVDPIEHEDAGMNYVRVLCKFDSDRYGLILPIAQAVEDLIIEQGLELGKVKRISHNRAKEAKESGASITLPWRKFKNANYELMKENQSQLIRKLAEKFGTVEELEDFLESHTTNLLKRMNQMEQKRKWGDLAEHVEDFKEAGLIKDTMLGPVLTRDGKEMKEFIMKNKCELEAEMRRNIRHAPGTGGRYRTVGSNSRKMSSIEFTNRNKTMRLSSSQWGGDLAVPETIIHAKKAALLRNNAPLTVKKEDLYIYGKRSYVPLDMCILIDASASMAGEKRQAACFLAEHMLLTGREKVAVVTFQEQKAHVVVPFTRNQKDLSHGLSNIVPGGMTPLASGIVTSVELIKSSRVHNPTLILITDGIPNYPLWSFDAEKDAMEAAQQIPSNKIRLLCIGVESNREYLEQLVEIAQGRLFIVDDLDRSNLINIVRSEKRLANLSAKD